MPGKHDVYVFNDGPTYKVRPAVSAGIAGKPFSFRNLTDETLNLTFPDGLLKEDTPRNIAPHTSKTFHIAKDADGLYRYQIDVVRKGLKKRARGESAPEMIVDG